jgi:hypothetical protein
MLYFKGFSDQHIQPAAQVLPVEIGRNALFQVLRLADVQQLSLFVVELVYTRAVGERAKV